jgi:vitamin B12 transporter
MKKEMKIFAFTLAACVWLSHLATLAQTDTLTSVRLDEVVVTATKFPKSLSETGKVLIVIDEDQLARSAGKDLSQLLNEQAGLVINGANSNPAKDKSLFLRGAAGKYTLILIDGVPLNDPSGIDGAFDLRLLSIDQVERIEILKGSQSTLYGSDAMAGVVNIITKKGNKEPLAGTGTLSYGSFNTLRGNASVSGKAGVFDYRVGYTRFATDGISEAKDKTGYSGFDKDGFDQNAWQLDLGFKPSGRFVLRPFMRYNDFSGQYDAGPFTDDTQTVYDASLLNYGANTEYKFKHGAINGMYAYNKTDRSFANAFGIFEYDGRFHHSELFVHYNWGDHYQLLGGAGFQQFKMIDANATLLNPSSQMTSPYVSFFIRNLKGFSAELGTRFVMHSVYGNNFTYSINPSYLLQNRVKFFMNYATGFKAPTLSQLYGPFGANELLVPEISHSFEGGIQLMSSDNRSDMRITWFTRKIDDIIAYTNRYVNWDKLDDHGIEAEFFYRMKKWTVSFNYTYVDGELTTPTSSGSETKANDFIRRPKHSAGFNMGYRASEQFFTSLNFKTFGKRNDVYFDLETFSSSAVVLDAYQLLDVYAEYKTGKTLKFFIDIRNLLNQEYFEVYGYNTQRLNATVGLQVMVGGVKK